MGGCRPEILYLNDEAAVDERHRRLEVVQGRDERSGNSLSAKSKKKRLQALIHVLLRLQTFIGPSYRKLVICAQTQYDVCGTPKQLTELSNRQCVGYSWTTSEGSHFLDFFNTERANRMWL
jgi:hypothetical protein